MCILVAKRHTAVAMHVTQERIGKKGVAKLVALANNASFPNMQSFAARTLSNLLQNGDNRTRFYKQELRVKGSIWKTQLAEAEEAEEAHSKRHMLGEYHSKLHLGGPGEDHLAPMDVSALLTSRTASSPTAATPFDTSAVDARDKFSDWLDGIAAEDAADNLASLGPLNGGKTPLAPRGSLQQNAGSAAAAGAGDDPQTPRVARLARLRNKQAALNHLYANRMPAFDDAGLGHSKPMRHRLKTNREARKNRARGTRC